MKNTRDIILRAKEFAKRSLIGLKSETQKEDYVLLLISRFLLLKEKIIKKDFDKDEIYFNVEKNKMFFEAIKYVVDKALERGQIKVGNKITVILEPENKDDFESQMVRKYVLMFHKIRDALAHGKYDVKDDYIIIRNIKDDYSVTCELDVQTLEFFSIIQAGRSKKTIASLVNDLNHIKNFYYPKEKIEIGKMLMYENNFKNNKPKVKKLPQVDLRFDKHDNYKYQKMNSEELKLYLYVIYNIVEKSNTLTNAEKIVIFNKVKQALEYLRDKKKYDPNKAQGVIKEISGLIGVEKEEDTIKVAAVYNYMQTFLSHKADRIEEIQNEEEKMALGSLRMKKLNCVFENNENYDRQNEAIDRLVATCVEDLKKQIEKYNKDGRVGQRRATNDLLFNSYYKKIVKSLASRNKMLISAIRNGIDHGNVKEIRGKLAIYDINNSKEQNSDDRKFYCFADPEDFYDITESLDEKRPSFEFGFKDLLDELKPIIKRETYDDLVDITLQINIINQQSLIGVLGRRLSELSR